MLVASSQPADAALAPLFRVQSPVELQDLLDATRMLLDELETKQRAATDNASSGSPQLGVDPDTDELREKFRIMKVGFGVQTVG
jgi:hypothetical protein